ncbi:MAG: site-2 protease family protein [Eubacteriales bacterium]|nr:site-2 protease family protein [Eubacteriales bacterium]MDD3571548.1 site-2 protease family protein [Eubacteriales bacterium]MDD4134656.1 site-2 protease family protein [Eubacteriales bacterium]
MTAFYILAAVLMFGVMITVHEAGHFFAARLFRIPVREFSIGFGPQLLKWKRKKHSTLFFLRAIPLGGYCAFYGEDDVSGESKSDPRAFGKHSVFKRLMTILMGPVMNFLLAFVVAVIFYTISGVPAPAGPTVTVVQSVNQDSPAEAAGILPGDQIISVNGYPVTDNLIPLIAQESGPNADTLAFSVLRGEEGAQDEVLLRVRPLFDNVEKRYMIGVNALTSTPAEWSPGSVGDVIKSSVVLCYNAGVSIISALKNLVTRGQGINELSGIVGITQLIVEETRQSQLQGYLYLMAVISINLGLINLLIFPGLDGSRMLFLVVEAIRGKPLEREGYVHAIGMILLFGLMIWITFRDIVRLF